MFRTWLTDLGCEFATSLRDVEIHGSVSAKLLANLENHQSIVSTWRSEYRPVHVSADQEIHPAEVWKGAA